MSRVMALDVGEKTIGVAISDESGLFAFPDKTIRRQDGYRRDMNSLKEIVSSRGIEEIVVGLPLNMDSSRGPQADKVLEFIEQLGRYVGTPIYMQDERLSTSESEKMLIAADRRRSERRQVIDSVAASVILQTYLDRKRGGRTAVNGA